MDGSASRVRETPVLSAEEVRKHIERGGIGWVRARHLLGTLPEECVDGRREHNRIVGTPGGNAGEAVLALAATEVTIGSSLNRAQLRDTMQRYLRHFGSFYMHSDHHALQHLTVDLQSDGRFTPFLDGGDPHAVESLVRRPPAKLQEALLSSLLKPENIGCGHLKLMLQHPEEYGVRRDLVEEVLRSVFEAMWREAPIEYVVLDGDHREGAVVNIVFDGALDPEGELPVVSPRVGDAQIFIRHPQAEEFMARNYSQRIGEITGVDGVDPQQFLSNLTSLRQRQLSATLGHLARGKPIYTARVKRDGSITVEAEE